MKWLLRGFLGIFVVCMFFLPLSAAEASIEEEDYDALRTLLQDALGEETDNEKVEIGFSNIVRYYEAHERSIKKYKDADYIYKYAKGRLLFDDGNYEEAYLCFHNLPAEFYDGANMSFYAVFCEAYLAFESALESNTVEEFQIAMDGFAEAKEMTDSPSLCDEMIAECEMKCFEMLRGKAENLCSKGKHDEAQKVFELIISFPNKLYSLKGVALKKNCIAHSTSALAEIYDYAVYYMTQGDYEKAVESFQKAAPYGDSNKHIVYCQGMIYIEQANENEKKGYKANKEIEAAKSAFMQLQDDEYEGANKLYKYAIARECEMNEFFQQAENLYSELVGVLDSNERLKLIKEGKRKHLVDFEKPSLSKWEGPTAHVNRTVDLYAGPGKEYAQEKNYKVNAESDFILCAQEDDFYLIEIEVGEKKARFWVVKNRVFYDDTSAMLNDCGKKKAVSYTLLDSDVCYGPGEEYMKREEHLQMGQSVTVYEAEDEYSMVEYVKNEKKYRGWILTESLASP